MLKLKYKNQDTIYDVKFEKISENVVQVTGNDFPIEDSGFTLSRNAEHWDGWDYLAFTTIYRNIDGGAQFSDNGEIYVEKPDEEIAAVETIEEPAEQERQIIQSQITELKNNLSASDYKVIKNVEAESVGKFAPYDKYELHAERQAIRDRINELEDELLILG